MILLGIFCRSPPSIVSLHLKPESSEMIKLVIEKTCSLMQTRWSTPGCRSTLLSSLLCRPALLHHCQTQTKRPSVAWLPPTPGVSCSWSWACDSAGSCKQCLSSSHLEFRHFMTVRLTFQYYQSFYLNLFQTNEWLLHWYSLCSW